MDGAQTFVLVIAAIVAALLVVAIAAWWMWRRITASERALIKRIGRLPLRRKLRLARLLATDRGTPLLARAIPLVLVLYLALPLDLIPDFIPVLGQLDDALVVLLAARIMLRLLPRDIIESHLASLEAA